MVNRVLVSVGYQKRWATRVLWLASLPPPSFRGRNAPPRQPSGPAKARTARIKAAGFLRDTSLRTWDFDAPTVDARWALNSTCL